MSEVDIDAASTLAAAIEAQLGPTVEVIVVGGDLGDSVRLRVVSVVEATIQLSRAQLVSARFSWADVLTPDLREAMLRARLEDHPLWDLFLELLDEWECRPMPHWGQQGCEAHHWTKGDWLDCPMRKAKAIRDGGRMSDL